ncbi:MAG: M15 family metallopeptidase [Peptoniphilaceae bacterium]|nr:M15 family metallopeptidase [Peptoniphilaceae bacterium]MDY6018685.1 M15 family metallopeptidase [Anaerococcus sp.]
MSNQSIRKLKRKKAKEKKQQRRKTILKATGGFVLIAALAFSFNNKKDDEFVIKNPSENRAAAATSSDTSTANEENRSYSGSTQIATSIGFEDVNIEDGKQIENDEYSNDLKSYVKAAKSQYCYQFPNDFSKTKTHINKGDYIAYYGSENSFSKIKIDNNFYYVNRYGLEKLDSDKSIKVLKGIIYVDQNNPLPNDFAPGLDKTASRALETMKQDMERKGLSIKVASDYRSYATEDKMNKAEDANATPAGLSEHQTGTAFDFYTNNNQYSNKFKDTKEYKWLSENAYKYGFIERYPETKTKQTQHSACPWYFRFVGVENAKEIYDNDLSLEEYLNIR